MSNRSTDQMGEISAITIPALRWTAHTILLTVGSTFVLLAWQPDVIVSQAGALIPLIIAALTTPFFYYASDRKFDSRLVLGAILLLMAVTSCLVFFTHGPDSPFFIIYVLLLFLVSALYPPIITLLLTALTILMYLMVTILYSRWIEPGFIPAGVFIRAAILLFSGWIIAQLSGYRLIMEAESARRKQLIDELEHAYENLAAQNATVEAQTATLEEINRELQTSLLELQHKQAELEKSRAELGILFGIVQTMSRGDNLEYVINYTLLQLTQIFPDTTIMVRLFDPELSHLTTYATWGNDLAPDSCLREKGSCPHEDCVAAHNGELFILSNRATDPLCPCTADEESIQSYLCAPLTPAGRIEGVITMASPFPDAFNVEQIRLFQVIVDQAAMAIQRALLFEQVRDMAIRDPLTQVYNHTFFYQRLDEEIERSRRTQTPLALVMFDIDDFKMFNDTLGHLAGDHLLCRIAQAVRENIRAIDTIARTGGEEFAVILPSTDINGGMVVGEKLRRLIETLEHDYLQKTNRPLTISVGVATYLEDGSDSQTLVHQADLRMYEAKHAGKNRVFGSSPRHPELPL